MEGKEVRFGIVASSLFAVVTTAASCGAVNAMHDSFTALGGMIPLINMQLGEIIVGGVGAGLYGMLIFVIVSIFVAGLMVGRTPEYVGKKIEAREVKMAMLAILVLPLMYLGWTAVAVVLPPAVASIANPGPHGFTEVLYAYTSATGNNGSAFAGLSGNTLFYNLTLASSMFAPAPARTPGLAWNYARTHRLEALPGGVTVFHINDHCAIAFFWVMPFFGCSLGKIPYAGTCSSTCTMRAIRRGPCPRVSSSPQRVLRVPPAIEAGPCVALKRSIQLRHARAHHPAARPVRALSLVRAQMPVLRFQLLHAERGAAAGALPAAPHTRPRRAGT